MPKKVSLVSHQIVIPSIHGVVNHDFDMRFQGAKDCIAYLLSSLLQVACLCCWILSCHCYHH